MSEGTFSDTAAHIKKKLFLLQPMETHLSGHMMFMQRRLNNVRRCINVMCLLGYDKTGQKQKQSQQAHDVNTTSPQRRLNVMTLHRIGRRCMNVMCLLRLASELANVDLMHMVDFWYFFTRETIFVTFVYFPAH